MPTVVFSDDHFIPAFSLDNVLDPNLKKIAQKYNVAFYQVDAACSVFMCMLHTHNKVMFTFDGENDREIIANLLETCPADTFVEHYYNTFMSKVINSNRFNVPVEGNKTLFAIIFKFAYKSFMFEYMYVNNTQGFRNRVMGDDPSPWCRVVNAEYVFEQYLYTA